jgi:SOS response regulatory protein OraA/RecX
MGFLMAQAQAQDVWSRFRPDDLIGLTAVVGGLLLAGITVLAICWRRVRLAELEAALKQQMLEKGMSAAEIDLVLRSPKPPEVTYRADEFADTKAAVVANLVEQSMPAEDIEKVLQAFQDNPDGAGEVKEKRKMIEAMAEQGMSGGDIARVLRAMYRPAGGLADSGAGEAVASAPQARV